MSHEHKDKDRLRELARQWLDLSEVAIGDLDDNIHAVFLGAALFAKGQPMTISELSRLPFIGSRRSAARWVDILIELGVAERSPKGIVTTALGEETGTFYFGKLLKVFSSARASS